MEVRAHEATGRNRGRTSGGTTAARVVERKEAERERRQHMKALCAKLASLIPKEHFANPDTMTQLGSLDEAASYIKKLKERVDELRHRRSSAQAMAATRGASGASIPATTPTTRGGAGSPEGEKHWEESAPVVEVRQHDVTSMHVVLVCSTQRPIMLHEVIRILEEEGADVVNANHSVAGDKIFYTINSRALSSRIGIDVSSVSERLRALV
ncbi:transcription factor bHLH162-like [Triticum dicoccoides]|uniref:transcription factor bHLH162-like n=1 Tax=Triticum dicoccoides TaxID=85692 RepID=UPI00188E4331|nr:transcription factor bHLH162-like [Triticum dicoccoides]XP_044336327.1 transcription factor bHLH162-like [Triticum aestivum]